MIKLHKAALLLSMGLASVIAAAAPLEVTELHGGVRHGAATPQVAEKLPAGGQLALSAGAVLLLTDLANRTRYLLAGPGLFVVDAAGAPRLVEGNGSVHPVGPLRVGPARKAEPGSSFAATVMSGAVMRSVADRSPVDPDRLPLIGAEFIWRNRTHTGDWTFILRGPDGAPVEQRQVADHRYRLPPEIVLQTNSTYRWEVYWSDAMAANQSESGEVRTVQLDPDLLPPPGATFGERLGAALALREAGLLERAREVAPELFTQTRQP